MDAVEIFLMGLVGLSALVFLILDNLDPPKQSVGGDYGKQASAAAGEVLEGESCEESEEREELIDDWEGVERSELEKSFGEAIVFVNSKKINGGGGLIGEDVKMELYGLQKVALDGPCYESQPMALNLSARSKWNAWHKLGNMSEEMAMEKYISILSKTVPNWNVKENLRSNGEVLQGDEDERRFEF